MSSAPNARSGWWIPAPGSVARPAWPLPVRWVWWLVHRPSLLIALVVAVILGAATGPRTVMVTAMLLSLALLAWRQYDRLSFDLTAGPILLGIVRSGWDYGARWRATMMLVGLGGRFDGEEYMPRIVRVWAGRWTDRLVIRMAVGQHPVDWTRRVDALAHAFGARSCHVQEIPDRPGYVLLTVGRADPLAQPVPSLPVPEPVDLGDVPIGRREDGYPWTVRLQGSHLLVVGVTGSGKGSVIWSLIRSLGPSVRDGIVNLWAFDLKGGMELSPGAPLFARFSCGPAEKMAGMLEDAVELMQDRVERLSGVTRRHEPTAAEPLIVVVIDELATLVAHAEEGDRRRITAALHLLLSHGRAAGVSVVATLQDPRRETVPFWDLFPTRIALALVESEHTDLVLGKGAQARGAACSRISPATPGIGWVWSDDQSDLARVRASYISDDDIAAMARAFAPHPDPDPELDPESDFDTPSMGVPRERRHGRR